MYAGAIAILDLFACFIVFIHIIPFSLLMKLQVNLGFYELQLDSLLLFASYHQTIYTCMMFGLFFLSLRLFILSHKSINKSLPDFVPVTMRSFYSTSVIFE